MANIDMLHTGNSGVETTFGNEGIDDTKVEAIREQQDAIRELMPNVEAIRTAIDEEIKAISDIRSYQKTVGELTTAKKREAFLDEMRARELYIGFLTRLRNGVDDQVGMAQAEANR